MSSLRKEALCSQGSLERSACLRRKSPSMMASSGHILKVSLSSERPSPLPESSSSRKSFLRPREASTPVKRSLVTLVFFWSFPSSISMTSAGLLARITRALEKRDSKGGPFSFSGFFGPEGASFRTITGSLRRNFLTSILRCKRGPSSRTRSPRAR